MTTRPTRTTGALPPNAHLDHYKKQAKALNLGRPVTGIERLKSLGYAQRFAQGPAWRGSAREAAMLEKKVRRI